MTKYYGARCRSCGRTQCVCPLTPPVGSASVAAMTDTQPGTSVAPAPDPHPEPTPLDEAKPDDGIVWEDPEPVAPSQPRNNALTNRVKEFLNNPGKWGRVKWYESDRGAERAVGRLNKAAEDGKLPAGQWEFTSRHINAEDGGGSKLYAKFTPEKMDPQKVEQAARERIERPVGDSLVQ